MQAKLFFLFCTLVLPLSGCSIDVNADGKSSTLSTETAVFAGGCFWCMEPPYDKLSGVISTISGYSNGHTKNPTYTEVSSGRTGHAEVLQVTYDPLKISYEELLTVFWRNIDPTRDNGQFCDNGNQYRPGIYYLNDAQLASANRSKEHIIASKIFPDSIKVEIEKAKKFFPAEEYHQDYYKKNPVRYKYYRYSCGRDKKLKELWGDRAG
ncbi:MAG: peptide-methionine (S)-S-oxide reductase MsrA [Gammaproteobacteria bacterium]|nr:peptide-methionine (S)-S-oxide reductase MsrA [Gammaproteobacteria bacterium]